MGIREALAELACPLVPQSLRRQRAEQRFFACREWGNLHWGAFDSFDAAKAFARAHVQTPRFELDHRQWLAQHEILEAHDYPVLFWLDRALRAQVASAQPRVFDLGGNVGVTWYAFKLWLDGAGRIDWQVGELPDTAALGRQIAAERGESQLRFSEGTQGLDGADVLLSAGTLQYIEQPLPAMLAPLAQRPRHLLINRLPLTSGAPFVTLQNSGGAIWPCRIDNSVAFMRAVEGAGYRFVDRWPCLENSADIPFHPERRLDHFHGFYFERN